MKLLNQTSPATRVSLGYITIGALFVVWTVVWYIYLRSNVPDASQGQYYLCGGCFATGVVLLIIGISTGQIGRASRPADDLPPTHLREVVGTPVVNNAGVAGVAPPAAAPVQQPVVTQPVVVQQPPPATTTVGQPVGR